LQFITFMAVNKSYNIHFSCKTQLLFNSKFEDFVKQQHEKGTNVCYFVDKNVWEAHPSKFLNIEKIVMIEGNENSKNFDNLEVYIQQLLELNVDKNHLLIGVGGGIVSDILGFVGSCYKRGIPFGLFPTTVLSSVDASIGGKNGLNFGAIKNVIGTIAQPEFIAYDLSFLKSLKKEDFNDGFAEIIKYGCIANPAILEFLEFFHFEYESFSEEKLIALFKSCIDIKCSIIEEDPFDKGTRKILNFGHTLGHAIESEYKISHGKAVAIGMMFACFISENNNTSISSLKIKSLLNQYFLPTSFSFDVDIMMQKITHDKKMNSNFIDFIVLEKLGKANIQKLSFESLRPLLIEFLDAKNN
jgi:3-dehydroquinate synthase